MLDYARKETRRKEVRMNVIELAKILKTAHDVVEEEWKKISPERKRRMVENIMKRAAARAKKKGAPK